MSLIGWITPVSLLAIITETSAFGPINIFSSIDKSTRPNLSTGIISTGFPLALAAAITDGCSTAETKTRSTSTPRNAMLLASVPPLVNVIICGKQPSQRPSVSRASLNNFRAARPSPCTDDALPPTSMAATIAAFTEGRSGLVAL